MALPIPGQQAASKQEMIQFVAPTIRESIGTAFKASVMSGTSSFLTKSPILRTLGGGALAENLEFRKRTMYEKQGRDPNTGRKLTKDEIAEINARRESYGTLGRIEDTVTAIFDLLRKGAGVGLGGGMGTIDPKPQKVVIEEPKDGETYALANEEAALEKEREDDKDQLESEERQQGFFSKLFGKRGTDKDGGGGLLSSLFGLIPTVLGLFKGGIVPMLTTLISSLGSMALSALTPLVSMFSLIAAPLVAVLLGGAAGLLIADWIAGLADEQRKRAEQETRDAMKEASTGSYKQAETPSGEKVYKLQTATGTIFGTAKELGISEADAKTIASGQTVQTDQGTLGAAVYRVDEKTGLAQDNLSADEMQALSIAKGEKTTQEASNVRKSESKFDEIERKMQDFQSSFLRRVSGAEEGGVNAGELVGQYNQIVQTLVRNAERYPQEFSKEKLMALGQKYNLFTSATTALANSDDRRISNETRRELDAKLIKKQGFGMEGSDYDRLTPDKVEIPGVGRFEISEKLSTVDRLVGKLPYLLNPLTGMIDLGKEGLSKIFAPEVNSVPGVDRSVSPPTPTGGISTPPILPTVPNSGVPSAADENAALRLQSNSTNVTNAPTNVVQQNNTSTVATVPISASRTGEDYNVFRMQFGMVAPT